MSRINIGGFNLDSDEIIEVSYKQAWYTEWLTGAGSIIMLLSIGGIVITLWEQSKILEGLFASIFNGAFALLLFYLADKKLNNYKMTVATMSNGRIEIHTRVFNTNEDFLSIYKKLKAYIK